MSTGLSSERDKWLARRRKGLGASEAASICGIRTRPTRLEIFLDKRGEITPDEPTEAMRWGLMLEPLIARAYEERTGLAISRTQIESVHPQYDWMGATIDGYDAGGDLVEFKAVGRWGARGLGEDGDVESLPEAWVVQVQHQMAVEEAQRCHLAVFVDMGLRLYTVQRNDDMIHDIITMEQEFWGLVQSGIPPAEFQSEDAEVLRRHFNRETGETLDWDRKGDMALAVIDFTRAQHVIKEQERLRDEMKARLLMAMGNASSATCGPYTLKRKLVNVKESVRTIKASSYVRFTVSSGEDE